MARLERFVLLLEGRAVVVLLLWARHTGNGGARRACPADCYRRVCVFVCVWVCVFVCVCVYHGQGNFRSLPRRHADTVVETSEESSTRDAIALSRHHQATHPPTSRHLSTSSTKDDAMMLCSTKCCPVDAAAACLLASSLNFFRSRACVLAVLCCLYARPPTGPIHALPFVLRWRCTVTYDASRQSGDRRAASQARALALADY